MKSIKLASLAPTTMLAIRLQIIQLTHLLIGSLFTTICGLEFRSIRNWPSRGLERLALVSPLHPIQGMVHDPFFLLVNYLLVLVSFGLGFQPIIHTPWKWWLWMFPYYILEPACRFERWLRRSIRNRVLRTSLPSLYRRGYRTLHSNDFKYLLAAINGVCEIFRLFVTYVLPFHRSVLEIGVSVGNVVTYIIPRPLSNRYEVLQRWVWLLHLFRIGRVWLSTYIIEGAPQGLSGYELRWMIQWLKRTWDHPVLDYCCLGYEFALIMDNLVFLSWVRRQIALHRRTFIDRLRDQLAAVDISERELELILYRMYPTRAISWIVQASLNLIFDIAIFATCILELW